MKYFIMSDIHGSASACENALSHFGSMKCEAIILLGDVLYHGPRNPLPDKYDPKAVCALLNPLSDKIIACRGNCDSEVDQMVLTFPMQAEYTYIVDNGVRIFSSHGHIYSPAEEFSDDPVVAGSKKPLLGRNSVELFGHIHIQMLYKNKAGIAVCNPGSVSLPKNNSAAGFAVYEDRVITLYDIDGNEQKSLKVF
jgi:uncharacterized protein